ncbi:MAG: thioredoxin domain-containing protein [Myxococcota bacterium]
MSKGSAVIAIMIAFIGGFAIGNVTGSSGDGGEEVANVDVEPAAGAGAAGAEGDAPAAPADGIERFRIPVTDAQPQKGPADALVTIVEWSEFQCPFCNRVLPTVQQIQREYEGKVRFVWRDNPLPFHQNAKPAATLAREAFQQGGSDKFWAAHDLLFQNQRALERADLERYAQQLGLNMAEVRAALDNDEHAAGITEDQQLASRVGARGTPNFFINGRQLTGAQPFARFKEVIDDEIRRAQALVEGGTPAAQVYASLTRNGRTQAAPPAQQQQRNARPQPDPNAVYKVEINGPHPQKGPDDALVTIVEFSDFECPFCSRVNPTVAQIRETYGNDVRIVWMNNPLPFHQNAGPAAQAALEAFDQRGSDAFWAMHDKMFENQRGLTRPNLESWAQEIGLNMAQFRAALDNEEHKATIERQQGLARQLGASGTPGFFINGRNLRGAQPFERFKAVIDEELAKARRLVQAGTARGQVYAKTIENGATSPQTVGGGAGAQAPAARQQPDADRVYEIPVPRNAPSKGPANAAVVIQEFSDFQCPFCSRVLPTVEQVVREYGDRVRIVWRDYPLPFHQQAGPAAQAAREVFTQAGSEKFWAYHDLLFQNQRALERADLERYAEQVGGINMARFRAALDNETHKAAVEADMAAVRTAGARIGTPSFFINGRLIQGAQPFPAFKAAIDRALEEAN